MVIGASALGGCSKGNPSWLETESGSGEATTASTTVDMTTTTTSETTTTTTDATTDATTTTTTGDPLECPPGDIYRPFFIDVARDNLTMADCTAPNNVDSFYAYYFSDPNSPTFFRCVDVNACDADSCLEVELDLPPEYSAILGNLGDCIFAEHETEWDAEVGKCRTRSLAVWDAADDPGTAAPKIVAAAHRPAGPPSLTDLTVKEAAERATCACESQGCPDYALPQSDWCCGGELSFGALAITNDVGENYRAAYYSIIQGLAMKYRGCSFSFHVTQAHDGAKDCAGDLTFKSGWYMQFLSC